MTDNTNVATATNTLPASSTSDAYALMKGKSHKSDFKKEDLGTPFIVIVQAASGFAKRSDPAYIEGATEGDIIDTLTLKPRKRMAFIPAKYIVEYTEWENPPRDDRGNRPRGKLVKRWGEDRSGYDAAKKFVHNGKEVDWGPREAPDGKTIINPAPTYVGLLLDESGTSLEAQLSLTGTQAKKSRRFNDLINALEIKDPVSGEVSEAPMFARIYQFTTVSEGDDSNTWMGWKIDPGPMVLDVTGGLSLFEKASRLRDKVDVEGIKPMENAATREATRSTAAEGAGTDNIPF